ncbi:unnamed protein product [Closterium sp. Yama58-4]|nr:unnamed protein product [Closterium sp. Yama58-4]
MDESDPQSNILPGGNMLNVDGSGVDGLDAGAGQPATGNGAAGLLRGNSPAGEGATSQSQSESSSGKLASGDTGSGGGGGAGQEYTMEALPTARQVEGAAVCHEEQSFWVNSRLRTVACNTSQPLITNAPDMLNNIFVPLYACPFQERLGPWGEGGKWICNVPSAIQPNPIVYSIHSSAAYGFELAASIALHTRPHVFSSSLSGAQQAAVKAEAHVEFHEVGLALAKDAKPTDVSLPDLLASTKHTYVDVLYLAAPCPECEVAFIRQLNASYGSNPASGLSRSGGLLPFGQIMMLLSHIGQTRQMLEVEYTLENLGYRLFHVETKPSGHLEVAYIHASLVQPPNPADCPVDTAGLKYPDHQQIDDASLCHAESTYQVNMALRRAAVGAEQPVTLSLAEMKELIYVPLYPCPYEERIGEWGDGGKWICMIPTALQSKPLVYSVGSNEQFAFEQGMAESVRTKAFTFDPFITATQQAHMRSLPFLHFHAIGVAGEESLAYYHKQNPDYDFKTLAQLMLFLNHTYVDVLKIDCEGCEVAFVRDIARAYGSEPATLASKGGVLPFGQVLMELHQITNTKAMLALLYTFESLGYRLFHVETNPLCLICIEVAYIHDSLLQPANPHACPKAPLNDPATLAKISATGGARAAVSSNQDTAEAAKDVPAAAKEPEAAPAAAAAASEAEAGDSTAGVIAPVTDTVEGDKEKPAVETGLGDAEKAAKAKEVAHLGGETAVPVASGATSDIAWKEPLGDTSHVDGSALCHADRSYYVNSRLRTVACNASQPLITNAPDMLNNIFVPLYACPFQERLGPWGEGGKWVCVAPTAFQSAPIVYSIHSSAAYGFELAASIALHTRPHVFSSSLSAAQQAAVKAEAHVEFHEVGLALAKDAKPTDVSLPDLLASTKHTYVDVLYLAPDCPECEVAFIRQLNASYGSNPASGLSRSGGLLPFGQIMMLLSNVQQVRQMLEVEYTLENLGYRLFHVETKPNGHLEVAYIHASLVQPPNPADCPVDTAGLKYPDHQQIDDAAVCQAESSFQVNMALRRAAVGAEQPVTLSLAEMKELIYVPLYPCPYEERIGEWGDGGKWVCMLASALKKQPIVYSVGSNEQFAFEQGMAESVRTKAFTFDPFITATQQAHMRSLPFLHFHAIGVAGEESLAYYHKQNPDYDFKTLAQLMLFLNHTYVDVLKIDCEGCEVAFVRDIARAYGSEPATLASKGGVLPFGQVLMELHQITNTKAMLALLYTFESLGYRLFHVETNPLCLICIEVAYIHDSLLQPANPHACPRAPLNDPATLAKISATSVGGAGAAAAAAADVSSNVDVPGAAEVDATGASETTTESETI